MCFTIEQCFAKRAKLTNPGWYSNGIKTKNYGSYPPSNTINGELVGSADGRASNHDLWNDDFKVTVLDSPIIHTVNFYQRGDCCHERNVGLQVWLNQKTIQCPLAETFEFVGTSQMLNMSYHEKNGLWVLRVNMMPLVFNCDTAVAATDITIVSVNPRLEIQEIEAISGEKCESLLPRVLT